MVIDNKDAIKLVEILKESKKLNQKKTAISFNEDGTRCSLTLSWKSKKQKDMCCDGSTAFMLGLMAAWTLGGSL